MSIRRTFTPTIILLLTAVVSASAQEPVEPIESRGYYTSDKLFSFYQELSSALRRAADEETANLPREEKTRRGVLDSSFLLNHYQVRSTPAMRDELRRVAFADHEALNRSKEEAGGLSLFEGLQEHTRTKAEATANALRVLQDHGVDVEGFVKRILDDQGRSGTVTWLYEAPTASQDAALQKMYWSILGDAVNPELEALEVY